MLKVFFSLVSVFTTKDRLLIDYTILSEIQEILNSTLSSLMD